MGAKFTVQYIVEELSAFRNFPLKMILKNKISQMQLLVLI
jgi:hypothetical protein